MLDLPGNREGKIFVWELQSSPPVLIARFAGFALTGTKRKFLIYVFNGFSYFVSPAGYLMRSQSLPLDRLPHPLMEGNYHLDSYGVLSINFLMFFYTPVELCICFRLLQHHSLLLWGWDNMALGCCPNQLVISSRSLLEECYRSIFFFSVQPAVCNWLLNYIGNKYLTKQTCWTACLIFPIYRSATSKILKSVWLKSISRRCCHQAVALFPLCNL